MSENFLYPFKREFLWGYKNENDQTIIEPVFDYVEPFTAEIALVKYHGKNNIINKKGELLIESGAKLIEKIGPNNWSYEVGSRKGLVSTSGKLVTQPVYGNFLKFSEGMVGVLTNKGCGYLDENGKMAIPDIFSAVRPFHDGLAIVTTMEGEDILITKDFKEILDDDLVQKYELYIDDFTDKIDRPLREVRKPAGETKLLSWVADGLYSFRDLDTQLEGICNKKGQVVLEPEYDLIGKEVNGYLPAFLNVKYIELDESYYKMLDNDICMDCIKIKDGYVLVTRHAYKKYFKDMTPGKVASHCEMTEDVFAALDFMGNEITPIDMPSRGDVREFVSSQNIKPSEAIIPKTREFIAKNRQRKFGLRNSKKEILLPFEYDEIIPVDDFYVLAKKDGYYLRCHIENGFTEGFEMNGKSYPNKYEKVFVLPNGKFIGHLKSLETLINKDLL